MTPTPEELVACLRGEAKDWGCGMATVSSGMLTDAADLLDAQAEQLRQMREALECIPLDLIDRTHDGLPVMVRISPGSRKQMQTALALPLSAAERVARSNAEKAGLLDWWFDEANEAARTGIRVLREMDDNKWSADRWIAEIKAAKEASNGS